MPFNLEKQCEEQKT